MADSKVTSLLQPESERDECRHSALFLLPFYSVWDGVDRIQGRLPSQFIPRNSLIDTPEVCGNQCFHDVGPVDKLSQR